MPCLVVIIALLFPRLAIVLLFLFSDFLHRAFDEPILPIIGFIFLPFTTLAYALAINAGGLAGMYLILVIVAVVVDLASLGGGAYRRPA